MKVLQNVEYFFSGGEFKKKIIQSLDSFEILDENYSSVTKENLEENVNKNFCIYGKYALLGNEIYFNCEKISDSDGNYFLYQDFTSPEMKQEYSESISFNEETIFINGTEYLKCEQPDCAVADSFPFTFDTERLEDFFSFITFELFSCAVNPYASKTK